jgi:hypothetical protein
MSNIEHAFAQTLNCRLRTLPSIDSTHGASGNIAAIATGKRWHPAFRCIA